LSRDEMGGGHDCPTTRVARVDSAQRNLGYGCVQCIQCMQRCAALDRRIAGSLDRWNWQAGRCLKRAMSSVASGLEGVRGSADVVMSLLFPVRARLLVQSSRLMRCGITSYCYFASPCIDVTAAPFDAQ
jgi:hypothetical protein